MSFTKRIVQLFRSPPCTVCLLCCRRSCMQPNLATASCEPPQAAPWRLCSHSCTLQALIFYKTVKAGFLLGVEQGSGFVIARRACSADSCPVRRHAQPLQLGRALPLRELAVSCCRFIN